MALASAALMQRRPIFRSSDVEETYAFLNGSGLGFDLASGARSRLDVQINGVQLPGMYIGYTQYGSPAELRMDPEYASYWIKLPVRGHLEAKFRDFEVSCDARCGVVLSPTRENLVRTEADGTRLNLALKPGALRRQLAALLGDAVKHPLDFAPALDLTRGHGQSLARFARLAAAELERPESALSHPMAAGAFVQFVMTGLLLRHSHNYTEALKRLERPITPRDVKRAMDYIEGNLDRTIELPDIVAASGVPGRTLLKHFRDFKGTSPMRYLRNTRFEQAREKLRRSEPEESISEIAEGHGFSHLGRFSVEYRRRFGETPSETLRRRGARLPTGGC